MRYVAENHVIEWSYTSGTPYDDPFNTVELDIIMTDPDGEELVVPTFWAGEQTWRVRYASPKQGVHRYQTRCSDTANQDLHGREGAVEVTPYTGSNSLFTHGPLQVARDRRYLEHHDGTPFLWLGDTWWMGLCKRLQWPDEFRELVADRSAKGFSVIQIVAGLYPDMQPFDERGANEAGFPWTTDFARVNPAYFDMADLRIAYLAQAGIVPCIVGCWGFFMDFAGAEVIRKHWRYLVARWAAYPVVWCAAGEALMLYYLQHADADQAEHKRSELRAAWSAVVRGIRADDPFRRPITIHPTRYGRDQVDDASVLDFEMLQTGHGGYPTLATTVNMVVESLAQEPRMPVLVGEVNYEGIVESSREEMQRFLFWTSLLSGAAGHTYGANGLWQLNRRDQPYGQSPHGTSWGDIPWNDAYLLAGSGQLGIGKRLLERYHWWQFEPRPDWIEPHADETNRMGAYAAGIPGAVRVVFVAAEASWIAWRGGMAIRGLEDGIHYRARYVNPKTGREHDLGHVVADAGGSYTLPKPPIFQDWIIVLEAGDHVQRAPGEAA